MNVDFNYLKEVKISSFYVTTFLPLFTLSITSFISKKLPASCSAFFWILNYSRHSFFPWQEDQLGIPESQIKPLTSTNWAWFNNWTTLIKRCSYGNRSYSLMPCPFTGPKMFGAGPNFLRKTINLFKYCGSHKHFVPD